GGDVLRVPVRGGDAAGGDRGRGDGRTAGAGVVRSAADDLAPAAGADAAAEQPADDLFERSTGRDASAKAWRAEWVRDRRGVVLLDDLPATDAVVAGGDRVHRAG